MTFCVGIRREDKSIWERRTPLVPQHVKEIIGHGVEIKVQPSEIRVFKEDEYEAAGARVDEDLSSCDAVFGVKEIPASFFRRGGTYVFFSHVIKGQSYNMPMLKKMMELECNLIDYETIVDDKGMRLVFFGWHAGVSGMVETLLALGKKLESQGINSPFAALKQPHEYDSIKEIKTVLDVIAHWIRTDGLPREVLPLTVGVTGYGNVSKGAQEMLDILPVTEVSPAELKNITADTPGAANTIFKVVFKEADMVVPKNNGDAFVLQDYYDHPEKYVGIFENYLPHLTALVNCIYWDERYPRLVTREYLKTRWKENRLLVIGDISCDINGSIEVLHKVTEPGDPAFVYHPKDDSTTDGYAGHGPVIVAVDILPAEIPRDASVYFSGVLKEYIPAVTKADFGVEFDDLVLPGPIKSGLILHRGKLTPRFEYINEYL